MTEAEKKAVSERMRKLGGTTKGQGESKVAARLTASGR